MTVIKLRPSGRATNELRKICITRKYTKYAEGSVLVKYGDTHVICNASIISGVPRFLKNSGCGWITAEYGMLPRSTNERMHREATRRHQSGRTMEIQRLIARSLRTIVNMKYIGENTIMVDCDIIQADGGTRAASITGACISVIDAIDYLKEKKIVKSDLLYTLIASVSVGIYKGMPIVDLDYLEDSNAETDMNIIMNAYGNFVEIQGTAEHKSFNIEELNVMLKLGRKAIASIIKKQQEVLVC